MAGRFLGDIMEINSMINDFSLLNQDEKIVKLSDYLGRKVIVYFYPKALTSACSLQACQYQKCLNRFVEQNVVVLGISKDSPKVLKKFQIKYNLEFDLLSDPDLIVAKEFGAYGLKKMYGKDYYGIIRSSFLISEDGKLMLKNYKVKAQNDADDMLSLLMKINNS